MKNKKEEIEKENSKESKLQKINREKGKKPDKKAIIDINKKENNNKIDYIPKNSLPYT
jgi:hypothetical protein